MRPRWGGGGRPATTPQSDAFNSPATMDLTPHVVQPVTGGTPIIGIPVGNGLFVPVTGGDPVVGIPLSP